jgi:capsular polysaccharide biosynthesis protein
MDLRGGDIRISAAQLPGDIGTRPSLKEDLRVVAEALGSRWMLILAVVIVCLGGGIAYMWQATPSYKSAVDILMDPRPRTIVGLDVVPTGLGSSSLGSDTGLVDSQVQLLSSRTLLTQVIHKLDLDQLPAKPAHASIFGGVASLARTLLYGPNQSDFEAGTPFDRTLAALQSSLKIERLGNTYVLRVTVTSDSSQRAADIANAIAAAYVSQGQDAVNQETRSTADALTARLAQLKASSDQAQQALEAYHPGHFPGRTEPAAVRSAPGPRPRHGLRRRPRARRWPRLAAAPALRPAPGPCRRAARARTGAAAPRHWAGHHAVRPPPATRGRLRRR